MTRSKWKNEQRNLHIGDLVLLTELNLPRRERITGKVIETFPGKDDLVQVVKVRTASGEFLRAVHQLCLTWMRSTLRPTQKIRSRWSRCRNFTEHSHVLGHS